MRRFYDPQPFSAGSLQQLGENASHHISRVLRMGVGDPLILFNGSGGEWLARIETISKDKVSVLPEQFYALNRQPPASVCVALPILKGERMDYALQKATELGAARFQLLLSERSEVRLPAERLSKRMAHWQQVIVSACEQCGLNLLPTLHAPLLLSDWLAADQSPLRLIGHPGARHTAAGQWPAHPEVTLLTGPEGGFSDTEVEAALAAGYQCWTLGERVLRAETAPCALLSALWMAHEALHNP